MSKEIFKFRPYLFDSFCTKDKVGRKRGRQLNCLYLHLTFVNNPRSGGVKKR